MQLLLRNFTTSTVYIAIVEYNEEYKYISEPIILELEAGQQCFLESSPRYFFGARICKRGRFYKSLFTERQNAIDFHLHERMYWSAIYYFNYNLNKYLRRHPEIPPAKVSINDDAINYLKEITFHALADKYNILLDIKCPCDD